MAVGGIDVGGTAVGGIAVSGATVLVKCRESVG